jgi:hypothetical protein
MFYICRKNLSAQTISNKTGRHDIAEILWKVALDSTVLTLTPFFIYFFLSYLFVSPIFGRITANTSFSLNIFLFAKYNK